jgi:hypothetical protein
MTADCRDSKSTVCFMGHAVITQGGLAAGIGVYPSANPIIGLIHRV